MIVKDEADWIEQCLESVRGLVSQMVVVDTGSKDKTVELARNLGAEVYEYAWKDDFAAARNFSIEKATCDWILVLDADEAIDKSEWEKIEDLTKDRKACYLLTQRHYTNDYRLSNYVPCSGALPEWERKYAGYFESSLVRLFPRKEEIVYSGKVHELVEYCLKDLPDYKIKDGKVTIHHYGHTPDVAAKKDKRPLYQDLGEAKTSNPDKTWKDFFELGIEYNIGGMLAESEVALKKAAELYPYYHDTWINLGYVQCELGHFEDAISSLKNALNLNPRSAQAFCNLGVVHMRQSRFDLAEKCLINATIIDPKYVNAFCNLGKTLANVQRYSEAVHFYRRAIELMPNCQTAIDDIKTIYEGLRKANEDKAAARKALARQKRVPAKSSRQKSPEQKSA